MFDQIRVDDMREFYLMLGMQELYKELQKNPKHILLSANTTLKSLYFVRLFVCLYACLFFLAILRLISLF